MFKVLRIMKRQLKSKSAKKVAKAVKEEEEQPTHENKVDLSQFKVENKRRLRSANNENISQNSQVKQKTATPTSSDLTRSHVKIEYDVEHVNKDGETAVPLLENEQVSVKSEKDVEGEKPRKVMKWSPKNWETALDNLREMRKHKDAPVDSMGCEKCFDTEADPKVCKVNVLFYICIILSVN